MNSSEGFFPAGWLALSSEQSAQIKAVLGKDVSAIPVYNVVPLGANNGYQPLNVVPGLACLVVHEFAQQQFDAQGVPHALPDDLARYPHNGNGAGNGIGNGNASGPDARATARLGEDDMRNAKLKPK